MRHQQRTAKVNARLGYLAEDSGGGMRNPGR